MPVLRTLTASHQRLAQIPTIGSSEKRDIPHGQLATRDPSRAFPLIGCETPHLYRGRHRES